MSSKAKSILVLDDDEDMLRFLNKILNTAGFTVFLASSPSRAMDLLEGEAPHLIITDLNMEPEDGFSFIQRVKAQKKYQEIPIIVLSALNDFASVKKVIASGITDYMIKPVEGPVLLRKVRKGLLLNDFIHWEAPNEQTPLDVVIEASITALGEVGMHLTGPFKLSPGIEVPLAVEDFHSSDLSSYYYRSSPRMKIYVSDGHFQNEIHFVSTNTRGNEAIRQLIQWCNQE